MSSARKVFQILTPKERRSTWVLLCQMGVGMVLEMVGIGIVIPAIGLLTQTDLGKKYPIVRPLLAALGNPAPGRLAVIGMLALVAVYIIKTLFLGYLVWRQNKFAYDVQANLSQRLFTAYLRQPYTFHLQRNSAQLIRNAITEVGQYTFSILLPGLLIVTESLVLIGITSLLVAVEPVGAIIMGSSLGITAWLFYHSTRSRIARWGIDRQLHEGLRIQHLQQGLGGVKDVQLLGRDADFIDRYRVHNIEAARVAHLQATLLQFPRLFLELLGVMGLAILVITMIAQGREMATIVPALALFAAAAFRLMPSVNRVLGAVQSLKYGRPVIDVLHAELSLSVPEPKHPSVPGVPFRRSVHVADVTFTYPDATTPAISGLTLTIRHGETVGIIGPSGSGKSTLVDVILGLLAPTSGRVMVDDVDARNNLRAWQDQIGYVPQSVFLTDDSLRRNIGFGLPVERISDEQVWLALESAQLAEFVRTLPAGLETLVGERGVRLSGGQRQRIGIARALYHDPPVLVLDEATSALDSVTEQGVVQAVAALRGNKTILIVAHRLSTIAHCDRLYRMEQGRVVEDGTPDEMLPVTLAV